jgi:hypothetical protein
MDIEPIYCYNCDAEARYYVDWEFSNQHDTHRTFMCQTCKDAFQFGQITPQNVWLIDNLSD